MSVQTLTRPSDDHGDDSLAAFLAQVPAARDYDLAELDAEPKLPHRPHRGADKRRAINESLKEGR